MTQPAQTPTQPPVPFRSGFVGIVGRPNVGKSTILNHYLGRTISIATPVPQTTRHKILGILSRPDAQVIFVDTPGIHDPMHALGKYMVRTAMAVLEEVDLLLAVVDARRGLQLEDRRVLEAVKTAKRPAFFVANKIDGVKHKAKVLPLIEEAQRFGCFRDYFPVSALRGDQMDVLLQHIVQALPPGPSWYEASQRTDRSMEFQIGELIREQVLRHTRQEVPHAVAVQVERVEDKPEQGVQVIYATIVAERDTQKGILIGKGGQLLKAIGEAARHQIETLVGRRVFLQLWVKAAGEWRDDPQQLKEFGYTGEG